MRISIDEAALIREFKKKEPQIQEELNRVGKRLFTDGVLSNAAPIIDTLLRMVSSLPTKDNKVEFYDTESDVAKSAKNWYIPKNTLDPHLIEMWDVDWELSRRDGIGKILIANRKQVSSKSNTFELFDLLWNGTEPYIATASMSNEKKKIVTKGKMYKSGMNKGNRRPDKVTYALSEQERFKKKYGKAAYKIWEEKVKDQMVHQGRLLGKRNYHISAVEQHRRMKLRKGKVEAEAGSRAIAFNVSEQERLSGARTYYGGDYSNTGHNITGGKAENKSITPWGGKTAGSGYKKFILATGLIREFAPPMNYYHRFAGRFFFNQIYRKGIEGKTLDDFHDYISTCVYRGLMMAAGPNVNPGFDKYEIEREMYYS